MPDPTPDRPPAVLRLGTRGSLLARTQSPTRRRRPASPPPGPAVDLHIIKTSGDRIADRPLHEFGGKGLFTKELEQGVLAAARWICRPQLQGRAGDDAAGRHDRPRHGCRPGAREPVRRASVAEGEIASRSAAGEEGSAPGASAGGARSGCPAGRDGGRSAGEDRHWPGGIRAKGQYDAILLAAAGLRRAGLFDPSIMTVLDQSAGMHAGRRAGGVGPAKPAGRRADAGPAAPLDHPLTAVCVAAVRGWCGTFRATAIPRSRRGHESS